MPEIITKLSMLLGVSFTSGINLYLTVCMVGLAGKFGWGNPVGLQGFQSLANWPVIILSGLLFVVEFLADKLPAVDHVWNAVHSFVRPVAAAAIGVMVVGDDPATGAAGWIMAGLGSALVATTTNAAKVGSRVMVAASPEPFSDILLSLAGDGVVLVLAGLAIAYPVPTAIVCAILLAIILYLLPLLWRAIAFAVRVAWQAAAALFVRDGVHHALQDMEPEDADALAKIKLAHKKAQLVLPANVKGLRGAGWLRRGKLIFLDGLVVFVYRKWMRRRIVQVPVAEIAYARLKRRVFSNLLWIQTPRGAISFLTTRRTDRRTDHALDLLGHAPPPQADDPAADASTPLPSPQAG